MYLLMLCNSNRKGQDEEHSLTFLFPLRAMIYTGLTSKLTLVSVVK